MSILEKQYKDLRAFLLLSATCKKPDDQKVIEGLLEPFQESITTISRTKEANRKDRDWYEHLTVVTEGGPSVGWIVNVSCRYRSVLNDILNVSA